MAKKGQHIPQKRNNQIMATMQRKHDENVLIRSASKANLLITCMVLHSKYGWGEKRLGRFLEEYRKVLVAYNDGYIEQAKDLEDVLWNECGIKIEL